MSLETLEIFRDLQHRGSETGVEREPTNYDIMRAIRKLASGMESLASDVDADLVAILKAVGAMNS